MTELSAEDRKELSYLNFKNDVRQLVDKVGYSNIIKYMIEQFDTIDDISNTQSIELFKLISYLESALGSYERLKKYV